MTINNRSSQALVFRMNFSHHSICLKGSPEEQKQTSGNLECLNDNFVFMCLRKWQRGNVLPVRFANKEGLKAEGSPGSCNHEISKFRILRNSSDKYICILNIFQKRVMHKAITPKQPADQYSNAQPGPEQQQQLPASSPQFYCFFTCWHMIRNVLLASLG